MTQYDRSRRGAKKAAKELGPGDEFFVVADISSRAGAFEDRQLVKRFTVTKRTRSWGAMVGGQSVEGIVLRDGPAYTERPAGIRGMWEPAPQVAGPLGVNEKRRLDKAELRNLTKETRDATREHRRVGRRRWL